eukprot:s206_g12.t1
MPLESLEEQVESLEDSSAVGSTKSSRKHPQQTFQIAMTRKFHQRCLRDGSPLNSQRGYERCVGVPDYASVKKRRACCFGGAWACCEFFFQLKEVGVSWKPSLIRDIHLEHTRKTGLLSYQMLFWYSAMRNACAEIYDTHASLRQILANLEHSSFGTEHMQNNIAQCLGPLVGHCNEHMMCGSTHLIAN